MSAGERFQIDLDDEADAQPAHKISSASPFVRDIVERDAVQSSTAPSAPRLKASSGFPSHTKRAVTSRFKQKRSEPVQQSSTGEPSSSPPSDSISIEKQQIDQENRDRIASMSTAEIEQARQEILGQLDPSLLQTLLRRADISSGSYEVDNIRSPERTYQKVEESYLKPGKQVTFKNDVKEESDADVAPEQNALSHDSIHFPRPQQPPDLDPSSETFLEDLHSKYFPSLPAEPDKLEWMRESKDAKNTYNPASTAFNPRDIRFDFKGALLAPATAAQISVSEGLHHHADAPDAAGYTIPELSHLARSTYAPQRCIAFQTLGRILYKLGKGEFGDPGEPGANTVGAEDTMGELARGLWREVELQRVIEHLVAESEGNGIDGGKHVSAKVYAIEAVWLWRKGGGRRWKAD